MENKNKIGPIEECVLPFGYADKHVLPQRLEEGQTQRLCGKNLASYRSIKTLFIRPISLIYDNFKRQGETDKKTEVNVLC